MKKNPIQISLKVKNPWPATKAMGRVALFVALLGVLLPAGSDAAITTISNLQNTTASVDWSTGGAWFGGVAPGTNNVALYDLTGNTTTNLDGNVTINGFQVTSSSGTKNITLAGNTLTVTGTLSKDGASSLSIRSQSGSFSGNIVNVIASNLRFGNTGTTQNNTINSLVITGKTTVSSGANLDLNVNTFSNTSNRGIFAEVENNGTFRILTNTVATGAVGGANVTLLSGNGTTQVHDTNSTATGTLHINGASGTATYSGVLQNGAADNTLVLQKSGNSSQTLSGNNTYTGGTTVAGGMLIGDHNSAFGTGSIAANGGTLRVATGRTISNTINVNGGELNVRGIASGAITFGASGGRVSGNGTISQAITLNSLNQVLAPGNSPGMQNFGTSQSWSSFTYEWELNSWSDIPIAGTDYDQISITGSLNLSSASANSIRLDLISLLADNTPGNVPGFFEANRQWTIVTTSGGITGFDVSHWDIVDTGFTSAPPWTGTWAVSASANQIFLNYSANVIPEASSVSLFGLGLLVVLARRRYARLRQM